MNIESNNVSFRPHEGYVPFLLGPLHCSWEKPDDPVEMMVEYTDAEGDCYEYGFRPLRDFTFTGLARVPSNARKIIFRFEYSIISWPNNSDANVRLAKLITSGEAGF